MNQKTVRATDVITIVTEPGALVFATRKEWKELPDSSLGELEGQKTECVFMGINCVFFLFQDTNPLDGYRGEYSLVKIKMDEDGKQDFYTMVLSSAEAEQLKRCRYSVWN